MLKWQHFSKIEDGGDRHLEFLKLCISYVINMFQIEVPVIPLIKMTIDQIQKKWQSFFEIQDGGDCHLEFLQLYISDLIDMFQIEVPIFPLFLVTIGKM